MSCVLPQSASKKSSCNLRASPLPSNPAMRLSLREPPDAQRFGDFPKRAARLLHVAGRLLAAHDVCRRVWIVFLERARRVRLLLNGIADARAVDADEYQ